MAARFARVKRIDRLIAAFDLFRRSHPDALLLLVGDGPLRAEYEEQIRRLQLEELVHFAGFRQNVYDYLRCADVSVLPSANEAFGLSYIESLAAGNLIRRMWCRMKPVWRGAWRITGMTTKMPPRGGRPLPDDSVWKKW